MQTFTFQCAIAEHCCQPIQLRLVSSAAHMNINKGYKIGSINIMYQFANSIVWKELLRSSKGKLVQRTQIQCTLWEVKCECLRIHMNSMNRKSLDLCFVSLHNKLVCTNCCRPMQKPEVELGVYCIGSGINHFPWPYTDWNSACFPPQIRAGEVDFWSAREAERDPVHYMGRYPPMFTIR